MRTLVIYYSRTGTTRNLARQLAERLDAEIAEIRCPRYDGGIFRYLLAGYDSVRGNLPAIDAPDASPANYDRVLLGCPVWTSHPSLPMRAYLSRKPELPPRIATFLTYGGHSPAERAAGELADLIPGTVERNLSLNAGAINDTEQKQIACEFAQKLRTT